MKKIILIFTILGSTFYFPAQTLSVAGSSNASGGIHETYYDSTDNLLYAIGTVTNAGGQTVEGFIQWDGTDWSPKGNTSLLDGNGLNAMILGSIAKNKDTLYAMADWDTLAVSGYATSKLMYWDNTQNNWLSTDYGIFGNQYSLNSYNDTLYAIGNLGGGLSESDSVSAFTGLGEIAYWNNNKWETVTPPTTWSNAPKDAVNYNGAMYINEYKYQNGVWSQVFTNNYTNYSIYKLHVWNGKLILGLKSETIGLDDLVVTYDGIQFDTIGSFNHYSRDITDFDGKLAVCGNFTTVNGVTIEEVAIWDGISWSGISNLNGTITNLGGYNNQLLLSSEESYPIYESVNWTSLGTIALYGNSSTVTCTIAATVTTTNVTTLGGNDGAATVSVTGGQGAISYAWSNGGTLDSITGVVAGTYQVVVSDAIVTGCSDTVIVVIGTNIVPTIPSPPTNLTVNAAFKSSVYDKMQLNWTDNSNDETGFIIERSLDSLTWVSIDSVVTDTVAYLDTALAMNTTYYYKVSAYNTAGISPFSNIASGTTVTITSINDNSIKPSWVVYPNPSNGIFTISTEIGNALTIHNALGQVIMSFNTQSKLTEIQLPSGMYIVKMNNATQKIIVK